MPNIQNKNLHPLLAVFLNWLFVGMGHMVLGQSNKGLWLFVTCSIGTLLCCVPGIIIAILGLVDVYRVAVAVQQGVEVEENEYKVELLYKICKILDKKAIYNA